METLNKINNINPDIFHAYDIRGQYPIEINEKIISQIAYSFILKIKNQSAGQRTKIKIIIGRDTRLSSPNLYHAAINSIKQQKSKIKIIEIGLTTTPMFYLLTHYFKADGGIMITASHNPKEFNGLKIVGKNAIPISGKEIGELVN